MKTRMMPIIMALCWLFKPNSGRFCLRAVFLRPEVVRRLVRLRVVVGFFLVLLVRAITHRFLARSL